MSGAIDASEGLDQADEFTLTGRTAVVTGASRGIGAEIAQWLALSGARVALVARSRNLLVQLADRIGNGAIAVDADLASVQSATEAAGRVRDALSGAPDILVNNAGIFQITPLEDMTVDTYSVALATNLIAPFVFTKAFLPEMRARAAGHIVTIGSVADRSIFPGNGVYSATKFGARAIHEVLREETRGSGVRVTLVSPSSVDTGIWEGIRFPDGGEPDRSGMLDRGAVANAVLFALTQPADVNIDEMRLSRA